MTHCRLVPIPKILQSRRGCLAVADFAVSFSFSLSLEIKCSKTFLYKLLPSISFPHFHTLSSCPSRAQQRVSVSISSEPPDPSRVVCNAIDANNQLHRRDRFATALIRLAVRLYLPHFSRNGSGPFNSALGEHLRRASTGHGGVPDRNLRRRPVVSYLL